VVHDFIHMLTSQRKISDRRLNGFEAYGLKNVWIKSETVARYGSFRSECSRETRVLGKSGLRL